jgi:hypothetical protein
MARPKAVFPSPVGARMTKDRPRKTRLVRESGNDLGESPRRT